jgi:hypothetical protein
MKYTFHIVDLFSSIPFGGNQQAVLPVLMGRRSENRGADVRACVLDRRSDGDGLDHALRSAFGVTGSTSHLVT